MYRTVTLKTLIVTIGLMSLCLLVMPVILLSWPDNLSQPIALAAESDAGSSETAEAGARSEQKIEKAGFFYRGSHHAHAFHSPYWWLKCAYGLDNTEAAPVRKYHDFLCSLIEHNPPWARTAERVFSSV